MNYATMEQQVKQLRQQLTVTEDPILIRQLQTEIQNLLQDAYENMDANDRLYLARHPHRPKARAYIEGLFENFIELHGDRNYRDDPALLAGLATFNQIPVTILAQNKGVSIDEKVTCNFGMMHPEGYRKAMRLAKQAEKFQRPIITFVDTAGAYPGKEAEERGQAQAIAESLALFSQLSVPIISIVIGEGGSGGALALSIGDRLYMLENSVYSVLSPEGFASILYKDETRAAEVALKMKLTAQDLLDLHIIDDVIAEPLVGIHLEFERVLNHLRDLLERDLTQLRKIKPVKLVAQRQQKIRKWGTHER